MMATGIDYILAWNEAAKLFKTKGNDWSSVEKAAETFARLGTDNTQQGTSKLCYNAGVIYKFLGDLPTAVSYLNMCLDKDQYNAMAYFQRAIMYYRMERFELAAKDNQRCIECMRQVTMIDYSQLGLDSRLYQHEAIFNEAACHLRLKNAKNCVDALIEVRKLVEKDSISAPKNFDICNALQSVKDGCSSIDIVDRDGDKLYTPPQAKLKNIANKDYLGKAKVVSCVQPGDTFSGFAGPKLREKHGFKSQAPPERPDSPRSVIPTPNTDRNLQVGKKQDGLPTIVSELTNCKINRPASPTHPPPKPVSKSNKVHDGPPTPSEHPNDIKGTGGKPPQMPTTSYRVEFISGSLLRKISVLKTTTYQEMLDEVGKLLGYAEGTFSLWLYRLLPSGFAYQEWVPQQVSHDLYVYYM
ncbi:neutrophil cytosol factor 2-like isoform X3 [Watersipora subatra]|uniref:neutrophil cytosol factor 2-like isoform X3 n=1 Tax=Watersipora subatra TaxID=2589382 RepID=UPI00355B6141